MISLSCVNHQRRLASTLVLDEVKHLLTRLSVETGERLVQHHDLAFTQNAAHQHRDLLHPQRQARPLDAGIGLDSARELLVDGVELVVPEDAPYGLWCHLVPY